MAQHSSEEKDCVHDIHKISNDIRENIESMKNERKQYEKKKKHIHKKLSRIREDRAGKINPIKTKLEERNENQKSLYNSVSLNR